MLIFYSLLTAECDVRGNERCWIESVIALVDDDTQEEAIDCLKRKGWEITDDGSCVCPYCSKGIEEDPHLKRVK